MLRGVDLVQEDHQAVLLEADQKKKGADRTVGQIHWMKWAM